MKEKGILIDPLEHGIQPIYTNNSRLVKKPSSAGVGWESCTTGDVRVVVGFDLLNKYVRDPPGTDLWMFSQVASDG